MDDKINKSKEKLKGVFDDLWGSMPDLSSISETIKEKTAPKQSSSTIDTSQIFDILSDLEKNLQEDLSTFQPSGKPSVPSGPSQGESPADPSKGADAVQTEAVPSEPETPPEPETDPMEDLNALVGLEDLKKDVAELISLVKMQKMRKDQGLKSVPVSLHLVFSGNPGTGKTTVARILARLYKQIGVLSKGQLVEVDRSGLVAGYVGQTAGKTQEKIKEAMGGILFIDEAYTLNKEGGNDFGQEAIDTILKAMEDHRDDFVVIVAGYTELMERFVNSNPGLKSRFNKYLFFKDYSAEELFAIFQGNCKKYEYHLDEDAEAAAKDAITAMVEEKAENFANAREVRNLFEKIITRQAARIAKLEGEVSKEEITRITKADVTACEEAKDAAGEVLTEAEKTETEPELPAEEISETAPEPTSEEKPDVSEANTSEEKEQ